MVCLNLHTSRQVTIMGTPRNPFGLEIPKDKLASFESTVEENRLKKKFIKTKLEAENLENGLRKLSMEFRDKNMDKYKRHLNRIGSQEDPAIMLHQEFKTLLSSNTVNGYHWLDKLRAKEAKLRQKLVVQYGGGHGGEEKVRRLEAQIMVPLDDNNA